MTHIHKKFTGEQIKVLLNAYEAGHLSRDEIENTLGIGKTRFFGLLKQFCRRATLVRLTCLIC